MRPIEELLREAIAGRRCVEAVFGGYRRGLCPHVLGTREGELRVLCFQYAGGSSRGLAPGGDWRCLQVDGLSRVSIVEGRWRTRAHSQPQRCVDEVELVAPLVSPAAPEAASRRSAGAAPGRAAARPPAPRRG